MVKNPIQVAMDMTNISVERVAEILGVTRQTVNNYMKSSGQIPIDKLMKLSQELKISLDVLCGSGEMPKGPVLKKVYSERAAALKGYIASAENLKNEIEGIKIDNELEKCRSERKKAVDELDDIIKGTRIKGRKPTVCAFGPSDAGKSTLINYLMGEEIAPAGYSPMTTVPTYFKHSAEKPAFLSEPV